MDRHDEYEHIQKVNVKSMPRTELTDYQYEAFLNKSKGTQERIDAVLSYLKTEYDEREVISKKFLSYWKVTNWCLVIIAIAQLSVHWKAIFKVAVLIFVTAFSKT